MDKNFKIKLLILYPLYDKVYGPYEREDGRKHLVLNNSKLAKGDKAKLRTLSYPKALIEVHHNRILIEDETTDHKDENFTNDEIDKPDPNDPFIMKMQEAAQRQLDKQAAIKPVEVIPQSITIKVPKNNRD